MKKSSYPGRIYASCIVLALLSIYMLIFEPIVIIGLLLLSIVVSILISFLLYKKEVEKGIEIKRWEKYQLLQIFPKRRMAIIYNEANDISGSISYDFFAEDPQKNHINKIYAAVPKKNGGKFKLLLFLNL